ncbi:hypothetical protein P3S68_030052 [Capsicum galapagoense]
MDMDLCLELKLTPSSLDDESQGHSPPSTLLEGPQPITADSIISETVGDKSHLEYRVAEGNVLPKDGIHEAFDNSTDDYKQLVEKGVPNAVLPLLRYHQCESFESSPSCQGSHSEDRHFRSDFDEIEAEEAFFSGQNDSSHHSDIVELAKANNHGYLQILCEYYQLKCPVRGSTIKFHPLDHIHPLEYYRPDEALLHIAGSTIDLKLCRSSLELEEGVG